MIWGFVVLLVVAVSFAYAAANTVPVTGAGDGQATISGYTVGNVQYVLASDPSKIASVEFTLTPLVSGASAPNTVSIQLETDGDWYECTISGTEWSCDISDELSVLLANQLRVVAAQ